jgi:hypothetical protein
MQKFNRNYVLNVGTAGGGLLTVEPPFTVEFDVTRNTLTSANVCSIRIYNLSKNNRNLLRFNAYDQGDYRVVQLFAGYGQNLSQIFSGNVTQAWSVREGTNFITTVESFDGGYAFNNGFSNTNFPAGTSLATVIGALAGSLPNVQPGYIGSYPGTIPRGIAVNGNTLSILRDLTGGGVFIDNGYVNCLGNNECIPANGITTIDDTTGLIGTPTLEQNYLHFDTLFEPRVVVGQQIQLNTTTGPLNAYNNKSLWNGLYKVVGVIHRGMISGAVCGDCITSIEVFAGTAALTTATGDIP